MTDMNPDLARILVTEDQIRQRVKQMAEQISSDYAGVDKLCLIGILKGAFIFMADLSRQIKIPQWLILWQFRYRKRQIPVLSG
jgi:hypoxanthine phosphoribosyltransferase